MHPARARAQVSTAVVHFQTFVVSSAWSTVVLCQKATELFCLDGGV